MKRKQQKEQQTPTLNEQGYVFVPFDKEQDGLLLDQIQFLYKEMNESARCLWEPISGGFRQGDALKYGKKEKKGGANVSDIHNAIFQKASGVLRSQGIHHPKGFSLRHLKFLVASPGSGPQAAHLDGVGKGHYVVALYVTESQTTQIAKVPYSKKDLREMTPQERLLEYPLPWPQEDESFYSENAQPGDLMMFSKDMIHRGPHHGGKTNRIVLFSVLAPSGEDDVDAFQFFPWSFAEEAYGFGSPEHVEMLEKNKSLDPLKHYDAKEAKRLQKLMKKME